jgi:uncharacterized membrane protein
MTHSLDFLPQYSGWLIALLLAAIAASYVAVRLATGPAVALASDWRLVALRIALIAALLFLLANPVRVSKTGGDIVPADMFLVADASASMTLDDAGDPRWSQAVRMMRSSLPQGDQVQANVKLFTFGRQLVALEPAELARPEALDAAGEPDTQLLAALRQLTSRFGQRPPAGVVLMSDGRARDAESAGEVAAHFRKLGVPIHVVPLGSNDAKGDASVISLIAPPVIRKHANVEVNVFIRSYGFANRTAELELASVAADGVTTKKLASTPVMLEDGFQSLNVTFNSDESLHTLRAQVVPLDDESAVDNNFSDADIQIDQSKLRILYLEGSGFALQPVIRNGRVMMSGPHSTLQDALQEDPDIECRVLLASGSTIMNDRGNIDAFPRTATELFSYDAVIFSNVPREMLTDEQLSWLKQWVELRGAGLCMVGGPRSFGDGGWAESAVGQMLPVDAAGDSSWVDDRPLAIQADLGDPPHPIMRLMEDRRRNRQTLAAIPTIRGLHTGFKVRPEVATVLATGVVGEATSGGFAGGLNALLGGRDGDDAQAGAAFPAIVAGRFGRGRTLAMGFPITAPAAEAWHAWGTAGAQHYTRFWRNVAYWLTDHSFVSRRRLAASTDKQYYEPGQTIAVAVEAFDDSSQPTGDYRLTAIVEPQSLDVESDYAPIRWPSGVDRESGDDSPLMMWGEEFTIPASRSPEGRPRYTVDLQLADASAVGSSSGARLEITAYENDAQIDSTSAPVQVLHDPFEQQSPFPDHDLLRELAAGSGGSVIRSSEQLGALLKGAPTIERPQETHKAPAWSRWWAISCLLGLVTAEWCWRRRLGLA